MIKLTAKKYNYTIQDNRRVWPKYSKQLLNIATQNSKATNDKVIGSMKELWLKIRSSGLRGTLANWTKFYNEEWGADGLEQAGKRVHGMLQKMQVTWISEALCIDYIKELVYNKTCMGLGGEERAIEVAAAHFGLSFRFSDAEEERKGIDGWIGGKPVQVKPHDSVYKAHVYNHADASKTLVITYKPKQKLCYIHSPEFMDGANEE